MEAGKLRKEGESIDKNSNKQNINDNNINNDIVKDAYGNEIKVEKQQVLSKSEKKSKAKKLMKQMKDGIKNNTLTEDEIAELEDKIAELKE